MFVVMNVNSFCFNKLMSDDARRLSGANSFKYISFSAPYTIINSLPFDLRLFFDDKQNRNEKHLLNQNPNLVELMLSIHDSRHSKTNIGNLSLNKSKVNLREKLNPIEEQKSDEDISQSSHSDSQKVAVFDNKPKKYEYLDLSKCNEVSLLDTNPENPMLIAIQPIMYRASNFLDIQNDDKDDENGADDEGDDLAELQKIFEHNEENEAIRQSTDLLQTMYKEKCPFRFLKKKTFIFQVTSMFYNQLSICCDVTSINGFYKLHFYTKFWFLNNTELPLSINFQEYDYEYGEISLPYVSKNFDFEEIETSKGKKKPKAKQQKAKSYEFLRKRIASDKNLMEMMRIKPWERFMLHRSINFGFLEALGNMYDNSYYSHRADHEQEYGISIDDYELDDYEPEDKHESEEQDNPYPPSLERKDSSDLENPTKTSQETRKFSIVNDEFKFPIENIDDLNRIRLFSNFNDDEFEQKNSKFMLRIENCGFDAEPFDISSLQALPQLSLNSKAKNKHVDMSSEYSIVPSFELLPYPFSKTAMVTFKSKFKVLNKCEFPIFVVQDDCDDNFCLFPHEKSIFHWTSANKKKVIRVRPEGCDFSGVFKIDKPCEFSLKINTQLYNFNQEANREGQNSGLILNVSIQEVASTLLIEFTNGSHIPPYRIENMTRHNIAVAQSKSSSGDYDCIGPYQIIGYALRHPLHEKALKVSIHSPGAFEKYGAFGNMLGLVDLNSFKSTETIETYDKVTKTHYVIYVRTERTMRVVKVQEKSEFELEHIEKESEEHQREFTFDFKMPKFGISFINSSTAEELMYLYIKQTDV